MHVSGLGAAAAGTLALLATSAWAAGRRTAQHAAAGEVGEERGGWRARHLADRVGDSTTATLVRNSRSWGTPSSLAKRHGPCQLKPGNLKAFMCSLGGCQWVIHSYGNTVGCNQLAPSEALEQMQC
eukprot:356232-Chlamydomonas_euryale.AAC.7